MSRYTATYACPCGFRTTAEARELINKVIKEHKKTCIDPGLSRHKREVPSDIEELPTARVMNLFKDIVPSS